MYLSPASSTSVDVAANAGGGIETGRCEGVPLLMSNAAFLDVDVLTATILKHGAIRRELPQRIAENAIHDLVVSQPKQDMEEGSAC